MSKNLKVTLLAILVVGVLLAVKNYKIDAENANSLATQKAEISNAQNALTNFINTNRSAINQLENKLDSILAQHKKQSTKPFSQRTKTTEQNFAIEYLINSETPDVKKTEINTPGSFNNNNLLVYHTKSTEEFYKSMLLTNLLNLANGTGQKQYSSNNAQIAVFNQATQGYGPIDVEPLKKLLQYQYFAVVQHIDALEPQLQGDNSFEAGYTKVDISIYELSTGKRIKKIPFIATNSENIKYVEMNGRPLISQSTLTNDLSNNLTEGVQNIIFKLKN
jgi:hypothetical protein